MNESYGGSSFDEQATFIALVEQSFFAYSDVDPLRIGGTEFISSEWENELAVEVIFQLRDYDYEWLSIQLNRDQLSKKSKSSIIRSCFEKASEFERPFLGSKLHYCGTELSALCLKSKIDAFAIGHNVESLTIRDRVGLGSLVTVYRATDSAETNSYLIRAPRPIEDSKRMTQHEVLRSEFNTLSNLSDAGIQGIPKLHRWLESDVGPIAICQYVDGVSLREMKDVELSVALNCVLALSRILENLHKKRIVHGDIKPENVLLSVDQSIFLIDFNAAIASNPADVQSERFSGTPSFMSLEAIAGGHSEVSIRRDIYALGALLYELVEGTPFVAASSRAEAFNGITVKSMNITDIFRATTPKGVKALVRFATELNPDDRFESFADFTRALEGVLLDPSACIAPIHDPRLVSWRLGRSIAEIGFWSNVLGPIVESLISVGSMGKLRIDQQMELLGCTAIGEEGKKSVSLGKRLGISIEVVKEDEFFSRLVMELNTGRFYDFQQIKNKLASVIEWVQRSEQVCLEFLESNAELKSYLNLGILLGVIPSWGGGKSEFISEVARSPVKNLRTAIEKVFNDSRLKNRRSRSQTIEYILIQSLLYDDLELP